MTFTVFVSSSDGPEPGAALVASLLALGARELMPLDDAERLADGFLDLTGDGACFYSNGMCPETVSGTTWMAATHATFDTGVIAVWADGSAVLWLLDED